MVVKKQVENQITFGKDRYHQHIEMCDWCTHHIGNGKWLEGTPNTWQGLENLKWSVDSMFGNTTFCFKNPEDFTMFLLRWR